MAKQDPITAAVSGLTKPAARSRNTDASAQSTPGITNWISELAIANWAYLTTVAVLLLPFYLAIPLGAGTIAAMVYWRERLAWMLTAARIRRAWMRAMPMTRVRRIERIPTGERLAVRVLPGGSVHGLETRSGPTGELAAALRVREVRVRRDPHDGSRAMVTLIRYDPFVPGECLPWPNLNATELSLHNPIPIGITDENEPVNIQFFQHNMLVGGEPGAGKSTIQSMIIATGARDPNTRMWLFDGKDVEFAPWAKTAHRLLGPDGKQAVMALTELRDVMAERLRELKRRGLRLLPVDSDLPLHLVMIDELAWYLTELRPKKLCADFDELLRALVARGRAAGIIVVATTHKPSHDVIPTSLRDLFGYKLAMRCTTWQASDTILGQGWHSQHYDASTIPGGQRGVGYLLAEAALPVRVKGFYLTDDHVRTIADEATDRGLEAWVDDATATDAADVPEEPAD